MLSTCFEDHPTLPCADLHTAKQALNEAVVLPTLRADIFQVGGRIVGHTYLQQSCTGSGHGCSLCPFQLPSATPPPATEFLNTCWSHGTCLQLTSTIVLPILWPGSTTGVLPGSGGKRRWSFACRSSRLDSTVCKRCLPCMHQLRYIYALCDLITAGPQEHVNAVEL